MKSKEIGLRLKHYRHSAGLTQRQLAEKIGTTWEMVSRYETGKNSPLSRIDSIADALDIPISKIIDDISVSDATSPYSATAIPLITKSSGNVTADLRNTKEFYNAPHWISHAGVDSFAILDSAVTIKTAAIPQNSVLYVSREKPLTTDDFILVQSGKEIHVRKAEHGISKASIIGTVMAYEARLR